MNAILQFGNFYVDVISIAIVVIFLIAIIKGLKDGFFQTLLNFAKIVVIFILGIIFAKPLADLLFNTGIGTKMIDSISSWLNSKNEIFQQVVTADNKEAILTQGFAALSIPEVLQSPLASLVGKYLGDTGGETLSVYLGQAITNYSLISISYLLIELVGCIIIAILSKAIKGIQKTLGLVGIDRLLGMVLAVVVAYLCIDGIMFALTFINLNEWGISDWLNQTMYLSEEYSDVFTISKFIYTHSIIKDIFAMFVK